jgi:hypothetical protein
LGSLLSRQAFIYLCFALVVSPFVTFGRSGFERGLLFSDHEERLEQTSKAADLLLLGESIRQPSVIVAGRWLPIMKGELFPDYEGHALGGNLIPLERGTVKYVYETNRSQLLNYRAQGLQVYYLPLTVTHTRNKFGFDPLQNGGVLLSSAPGIKTMPVVASGS